MNGSGLPYQLFSLGDSAITLDFGNRIDAALNEEVMARYREWLLEPLPGMIEMVPAYSSLTIFYDPLQVCRQPQHPTAFEQVKAAIEQRLQYPVSKTAPSNPLRRIPVCYEKEYGPDLEKLAAALQYSPEEVIRLHTATTCRVFLLGFLPGFAYLGGMDERLALPRKPQPVPVKAGSVGIAGKQTGIYPLDSPGGWHIIGRTPLRMFDPAATTPVWLQTGDQVQFIAISTEEYLAIQNDPLQWEGGLA